MRALIFLALLSGCSVTSVPSYVTEYHISTHIDDRRSYIASEDLDEWTLDALAFWMTHKPEWECCIRNWTRMHNAIRVHFTHQCPVNCADDGNYLSCYGYINFQTRDIYVGDCGMDREVYRHEFGHWILMYCGGVSGEASHRLFEATGFSPARGGAGR